MRFVSKLARDLHDNGHEQIAAAVLRTYQEIESTTSGFYEAQLSERLVSPRCLGGTNIHHGAYLRTALDILESEKFIQKKIGIYFVR